MKKLIHIVGAITSVIILIGLFAYNTVAGQNALFKTAAKSVMGQTSEPYDGMRVIVCGSASPLGNDPNRAQACIAVITPEHFFLFDVGARSPLRINQARMPLARLDGVFFTHFHSDHIAAQPDVNLTSWVQGRRSSLHVYGPSGVERVVAGFNRAYKLDRGYRMDYKGRSVVISGDSNAADSLFAAAAGIKQLVYYHVVPVPAHPDEIIVHES